MKQLFANKSPLPENLKDQLAYVDLFREYPEAKLIYDLLGVIDSKSSALFEYNGILIAILAIVFFGNTSDFGWPEVILVIVAFLFLSASTVICLLVVRLYWFDYQALCHDTENISDVKTIRKERVTGEGIRVASWRTKRYWLAWNFSFVGTLIFVVFIMVRILQLTLA